MYEGKLKQRSQGLNEHGCKKARSSVSSLMRVRVCLAAFDCVSPPVALPVLEGGHEIIVTRVGVS